MSGGWGPKTEDEPLPLTNKWAVRTVQLYPPKHAGHINPRTEEGLENLCSCYGSCLQLHQECSYWL